MVGVRAPERLETGAMCAWLRSLDAAVSRGEGVHAPLAAPPALLAAALHQGVAGLQEAVLARLAVAAVTAGVSRLEVHLEHPTLIEAVLEALRAHPANITTLMLTLGPRTALGGLLSESLRGMSALTCLTLTPSATDAHLAALAVATPPLHTLDVSYCTGVSDKGMRSLLGSGGGAHTVREVLEGMCEGGGQAPASTLHTVNLWGTTVTTRGCVLVLSACPALTALTCRWSGEALDVVVRGGRTAPLALSQLLLAEVPLPPLAPVASLCPHLASLVARRPPDTLSVGQVLGTAPSLTALTLLQFVPAREAWLPGGPVPRLTYLHLSLLDPRPVHLPTLAHTCPALTHLCLEGITPTLPHPDPPPAPSSRLETLRIMTPPTMNQAIDPEVVVWAVVWACAATSIDLGYCERLTDHHLHQVLQRGALSQVEDLRLSGASQVTEEGVDTLVASCPRLRRLALKMLPKDRLAQLESLKVKIRQKNLDLELITYGWKF